MIDEFFTCAVGAACAVFKSQKGWVAVVKPGRVMFELAGVPEPLAKEALRLAAQKLPIKSKFVKREGGDLFAG